jgi:cytochrome c oxidase subunit 2
MRRSYSDKWHFVIVGILVLVVGALVYWGLYVALPLPLAASTQSATVDWVFQAHMILLSFLFALVVVFMLYAIVAFRRRDGDTDEGEHFEGNSVLEIVWTVIPLIVVVVFGYIGVQTLRTIMEPSPDQLVVEVVGRQWSWQFTYADTGTVAAELVLPVNQPAIMKMNAEDVIHSFWVPEFRLKKDLVPGTETEVLFTPTVEGEYTLGCAEICGLSHTYMVAPVRVVSQAEYVAWLDTQVANGNGSFDITDGQQAAAEAATQN